MAKLENRTRNNRKSPEDLEQSRSRKAVIPVEKALQNQPKARQDSSLQTVRNWVGQNFLSFLSLQKKKDLRDKENLWNLIEEAYGNWSELYEFAHKSFSELWDLLNLIEHDTSGWFRVAPKGNKSFVSIGDAGYSFAAGIEKNHSRGAPMPEKFILVTLAHSDHHSDGLGDERALGRPEPIDDSLIGIKACNPKDARKAFETCSAMLQKIEGSKVVIRVYSETLGARGVSVPLSNFRTNSLSQLVKGLYVALNLDQVKDLRTFFQPGTKIELIEHSRIK